MKALARYWFFAAPAQRLAMLRLLIGLFCLAYLLTQFARLSSYQHLARDQFQPIGVAAFLSEPLPEAWLPWITLFTLVFCIAFTLGLRFAVTAPVFAALFLWIVTYRHCWGQIFHSDNLLVLHVIALAAGRSADAWSLDVVHGRSYEREASTGIYGWPIRVMVFTAIIVYVLCGVAKLRHSGIAWMTSDILRHQIALDNLRKIELGHIHSPIGVWSLRFREPFVWMAWFTMIVELGAPTALLHRKIAKIWALAAWSFHVGIVALMAIVFSYMVSGVAYAPLFEVERLAKIGFIGRLLAWLEPKSNREITTTLSTHLA